MEFEAKEIAHCGFSYKDSYLTPDLIREYNAVFDKAEQAVRKNPEQLIRVKSARLPLYYAMLEIMKDHCITQCVIMIPY